MPLATFTHGGKGASMFDAMVEAIGEGWAIAIVVGVITGLVWLCVKVGASGLDVLGDIGDLFSDD